ncbi:MAG: hypothetical protein PW791_06590 [Neorhizobium sp.]|jgi:uncharacterized low-complexity protein|nr:hypothetical protein [Neorhizobium sp.]
MKNVLLAQSLAPALALALGLIATAANAADPFLDGAYGNKGGCLFAKSGDPGDDDTFFTLDDDGITTSEMTCDFTANATKTANGYSVPAQCDADGEDTKRGTATLAFSDKGYAITLPGGKTWGPYPKCQ